MFAPLVLALGLSEDVPFFAADSAEKVSMWTTSEAEIAYDAAENGMKVVFGTSEWPSIHLKPSQPWDFSGAGTLAVVVANPNKEAVSLGIRADDDASANGLNHSQQGMITVPARTTATVGLSVGGDPKTYGMNGLPKPKGFVAIASGGAPGWNPAHVVDLQLFMHKPASATTLVIRELRLVPAVSMDGIVDAYGQYTNDLWPGKLKSDADFRARKAREAKELQAKPALPGRDKFGGWEGGKKQAATGYFRTAKLDGRWWLVDPEGNLFFSNGCDCLNQYGDTFVAGREKMFSWLPEKGDPLDEFAGYGSTDHGGKHKEGKTFNFYGANLYRKYGPTWKANWRETALARLPSWGFNTIGNWSDASLYANGRVPYVQTFHINGGHKRIASGSDFWGLMHDPFDPEFRASVRKSVAPADEHKKDPFCVGTFVDNELSWAGQGPESGRYGLAIGALASGPDSPAKLAILAQLRSKYGKVEALNEAWQTSFASWEAMVAPLKDAWAFTEEQKNDLAAFVGLLSETYHRIVREELKRVDPNHLYLGCRFAWYGRDAVFAAAKYSDVVSFNIYSQAPERKEWDWINSLDRPAIIGEFHFGALDRGMFHPGLVDAGSQAGRAAMYKRYVTAVAENPAFVGCHWFQYFDEPLVGRTLDGENYQIGMVDVTDTPYPEAVAAARQIHAKVYELHSRAK